MLFFWDKAEIGDQQATAFIRNSATMSSRSIVLLCALFLCVVQVSVARPIEETISALLDNSLVQGIQNGVKELNKTVDEIKNNVRLQITKFWDNSNFLFQPIVLDINKHGTDLIFSVYQVVIKFVQMAMANEMQPVPEAAQ